MGPYFYRALRFHPLKQRSQPTCGSLHRQGHFRPATAHCRRNQKGYGSWTVAKSRQHLLFSQLYPCLDPGLWSQAQKRDCNGYVSGLLFEGHRGLCPLSQAFQEPVTIGPLVQLCGGHLQIVRVAHLPVNQEKKISTCKFVKNHPVFIMYYSFKMQVTHHMRRIASTTAKGVSGGAVFFERSLARSLSRQQQALSLSSCEAELYALQSVYQENVYQENVLFGKLIYHLLFVFH